ncbi:MAG: hypothetical protein HY863_17675 [Chloroflexi bacterium]|nr:hypothetical protein [Chloroflexota bacterium]
MNPKNLFSKIFLIVVGVAVGVVVSLSAKTGAQNDVVTYLEERYKQQNIPIAEITVLQESPLRLQIVIQTAGDGRTGTPDDPINFHMVEREVVLAAKKGYFVGSFSRVFVNSKGEKFPKADTPVYTDPDTLNVAPSRIADNVTKDMVSEDLNLYGMSLVNMDVSSSDGLQSLTLQVSSLSLEEANRAGPELVASLPDLIHKINAQGAQIQICRFEIRDEKGEILLNYLLDLQLHSQSWWADEKFTDTWSEGPPP